MLIMNEKVIVAGHGSLGVGSHSYLSIHVNHIDPSQVVGSTVHDDEVDYINEINFHNLDIEEVKRVLENLKSISESNPKLDFFDGWIVDFSKFDENSVGVFKKYLEYSLQPRDLFIYAC